MARRALEILEAAGLPAEFSYGGLLKDDTRAFMTFEIGETTIAGDKYRDYLSLWWAWDGSLSPTIVLSRTRVVCNNTRLLAEGSAQGLVKAKSTKACQDNLAQRGSALTEMLKTRDADRARGEKLAQIKITSKQALKAILVSLGVSSGEKSDASTRQMNKADAAWKSYVSGPGARPGTLLGLEEGLLHYWEHKSGVKATGKSKPAADLMFSNWWGSIAKQKAGSRKIVDELLAQAQAAQPEGVSLEAAGLDVQLA
jgi:hypothetical protein